MKLIIPCDQVFAEEYNSLVPFSVPCGHPRTSGFQHFIAATLSLPPAASKDKAGSISAV